MTGFTENEMRLARLLMHRVDTGALTREDAGVAGMRSVGPAVQMAAHNGRAWYCTNGTPSIPLGRTFQDAKRSIQSLAHETTAEDVRARCS